MNPLREDLAEAMEAMSLAITASGGGHNELLGCLSESGFQPLAVCLFLLGQTPADLKRIRFAEAVGFLFDRFDSPDWLKIFEVAKELRVNQYSLLFSRPGGPPKQKLKKPFCVRKSLVESLVEYFRAPEFVALETPMFCDSLPKDLVFPFGVWLMDCLDLKIIGTNLESGGDLEIHRCQSLKKIPNDLKVHGDLTIQDLPNLVSIGSNIQVEGDLDLYNLPSLSRHCSNIEIGGTLRIARCPRLQNFGKGMTLRGINYRAGD